MPFLDSIFLGNPVVRWVQATIVISAIILFGYLLKKVLKHFGAVQRYKSNQKLSYLVYQQLAATSMLFIFLGALYAGSSVLFVPESFRSGIRIAFVLIAMIQVGLWSAGAVEFWISWKKQELSSEDRSKASTISALGIFVKVVIWVVVLLLALDNFPGVDITSLIAGLGIVGIAVGLALQSILSDLFGSLTIALDKPFVIGDLIQIGQFSGNVEHIGLKSTRVRSISGEQLVISNSDILSSRLQNFERMTRRRVKLSLNVDYETPSATLENISTLIKEIITNKPDVTFDRAHFKSIGEFGLNYEVIYFIETADFMLYMDRQQEINLEIFRKFSDNGIRFYPIPLNYRSRNSDIKPQDELTIK